MKILVTGATGFLGTHLCEKLKKLNHEVIQLNSKNCDLTQWGSLEQYSSVQLDQIFHLAAWTQAGDFCLTHSGEQWIINQQINTNVLTWWKGRQSQAKMICMGTSCAYSPDHELREENYMLGHPIESLFTYAMTKRMLYAGLLAFKKQFQMNYLCLVPSTLYGPGYHTDGRQMHFIFDLIRKILRGKYFNEPVILWGTGEQKRELVYVNDFVEIMLKLSSTIHNDLVNIGAGEEFSIRHFAKLICDKVGYDFSRIQFDTTRYVGAQSKCLNVEKMKDSIKNLQLIPLEEGLGRTIDWFCSEREKLLPRASVL